MIKTVFEVLAIVALHVWLALGAFVALRWRATRRVDYTPRRLEDIPLAERIEAAIPRIGDEVEEWLKDQEERTP